MPRRGIRSAPAVERAPRETAGLFCRARDRCRSWRRKGARHRSPPSTRAVIQPCAVSRPGTGWSAGL